MGEEITTHGYSTLTFAKWTTIIIAELVVTSSLGSSLEYRVMVMEWLWLWNGYGYAYGMVLVWLSLWYGVRSR
jgi:hypothetical protein